MKFISTKNNLQILHEDNHIIVINKRVGDIVQGDKTGDKPLSDVVKEYIKEKYNKPGDVFLGVVHRLDRPTTGTVVFAKTSKALTRLNETFKNRETQKTYWAVVKNCPPKEKDTLIHFLKRNQRAPTQAERKRLTMGYTLIFWGYNIAFQIIGVAVFAMQDPEIWQNFLLYLQQAQFLSIVLIMALLLAIPLYVLTYWFYGPQAKRMSVKMFGHE